MRWMSRVHRDDEGAVLVLMAVLLVVVVGFIAFAVDVSALYQERRELQNGADAAALAIAEDCALGAPGCLTPYTRAEQFADANATDGAAAVDEVDLDLIGRSVEVTTSTETAGGGVLFEPWFGKVIGWNGTTVHATARVVWGYLGGTSTLPLIISECEYNKYFPAAIVPDPAQHGLPDPAVYSPAVIFTHTVAPECASVEPGHDADGDGKLPGGFGWLDTAASCVSYIEGGWAFADPGASPSTGCSVEEFKANTLGKTIWIPIFWDADGVVGGGAGGKYEIAGFGAFYVTGYKFTGHYKEKSLVTGSYPCSGSTHCIEGYFTTGTAPTGDPGGEDYGVVIISLEA